MNRPRSAGAILVALALLAGCSDDEPPTGITEPTDIQLTQASETNPQGVIDEFNTVPRFDVQLEVRGSLRPHQPIHLVVSGQAHFATEDAEIRLILPEVAAAEQSSWEVVEMELGKPLPPQLSQRGPLAAGQRFSEKVTVTIPEPGYYAALASVIQRSNEPLEADGRVTTDVTHKLIWLWIDKDGGRITDQ